MILDKNYYLNNDTLFIAKDLLGKSIVLLSKDNKIIGKYVITETEAYHTALDKANHAYKGRTKRNNVMYYPGGHIYVYLCYGIHNLLNIVTGEEGNPSAVLIRGIDNIYGPGRVTKALSVNLSLNERLIYDNPILSIIDDGLLVNTGLEVIDPLNNLKYTIKSLPRVGINYAKEYKDKLWRFSIKINS